MFMACFEFDQLDAGQVYVRAMAIVDQVGLRIDVEDHTRAGVHL